MRALLCHCRCRLEAEDVEDLRELVRDHLRREHPAVAFSDEGVERLVARSYRYECVEEYLGGGPDEEFGPEPYQVGCLWAFPVIESAKEQILAGEGREVGTHAATNARNGDAAGSSYRTLRG